MKVIKDNEELKSYIKDGSIVFNESIVCEFDINVNANITAWDITAWDITAHNITADNIRAHDITAWNITAANITAWDITAHNITADNITANNITADNITAADISYYAFCISYKNIECTSIKGRRENSFHKCLDGELKIKPQEVVMTIAEIEQKLGINNLKIKK